ncbi:gap junction delta-4 protein isoform X1 [Coregonus clupeaformis]|uniref:gap junction delta-4 protein isoform X1 n=2 Tax=Coregonus clupeaformis TaxID=59861 RepID=UPI001BE00DB1|nr:gap junction delta-4 protein isoform X1 [Coregonus clupeaformis]
MGRQSASEVVFISLNHNITLVGKIWLILMILLRILVLLFAGYPLYQDEQERFVCNTIQPGCANACYDIFAPISLFRFWLVQLLILCLPYVIFVIYVIHKVTSRLTIDTTDPSDRVRAGPLYQIQQESFRKTALTKTALQAQHGRTQCFTGAYILHLLFRILLEAGFGVAHYYLFGFYIPRRFLCQQIPCTTQVDCYISRPTEKTIILNFMLGAGALSLLLNMADLICAIKRSVRQKTKTKMLVEKMYEEEQYYLPSSGGSRGMEGNLPLHPQDLVVEPGTFRKRGASKSSTADQRAYPHLGEAEHPSAPRCGSSFSSGPSGSNTNGNNLYPAAQEEGPEAEGSEVALCPVDPVGTPRSIRVSKRSRLKPPPPPRRDLCPPTATAAGVPPGTVVCTRRVGQYTLVEMTAPDLQSNTSEGQEKRSEWV